MNKKITITHPDNFELQTIETAIPESLVDTVNNSLKNISGF